MKERRPLRIHLNHEGKVEESGVAQPAATIIAENKTHLVVKVPAHDYWVGLNMPRGYASPETVVYEKETPCDPGTWKRLVVFDAIAWENTRKKKDA